MRTINKKRAEILVDSMGESVSGATTIDYLITNLMANCPSYQETILCSNLCINEPQYFPIIRLHTAFNVDFSNLENAIEGNYAFNPKCKKCHKEEGNSVEIIYGPLLAIEVRIYKNFFFFLK